MSPATSSWLSAAKKVSLLTSATKSSQGSAADTEAGQRPMSDFVSHPVKSAWSKSSSKETMEDFDEGLNRAVAAFMSSNGKTGPAIVCTAYLPRSENASAMLTFHPIYKGVLERFVAINAAKLEAQDFIDHLRTKDLPNATSVHEAFEDYCESFGTIRPTEGSYIVTDKHVLQGARDDLNHAAVTEYDARVKGRTNLLTSRSRRDAIEKDVYDDFTVEEVDPKVRVSRISVKNSLTMPDKLPSHDNETGSSGTCSVVRHVDTTIDGTAYTQRLPLESTEVRGLTFKADS